MDSRDLTAERDALKQEIWESFLDTFPHYEDMTDTFEDIRFEEEEIKNWKEDWEEELEQIEDIDNLEEEVSDSEWDCGIYFIPSEDFEDYCQELVEDIGDLPSNLPGYIANNIDWEGVADDLRVDYNEVSFRGKDYLYR